VNDYARYVDPDPGHDIDDVTEQVFGLRGKVGTEARMTGYFENGERHVGEGIGGIAAMSCFQQKFCTCHLNPCFRICCV